MTGRYPPLVSDNNDHFFLTPISSFTYPAEERGTRHRLPAQLTPLVGRERDVAQACALLRQPEVHLLTLTGTGGVGKTRLGFAVASELIDEFADGVCFVSLASITDPNLVLPTIAQALGLKEPGDLPFAEWLTASLHKKSLLLFLDNFEQVIAAAPALTALLERCPALKFLVTSREVLRVRDEQAFHVLPLTLFIFQGDSVKVRSLLEESLALSRELGSGSINSTVLLMRLCLSPGKLEAAIQVLRQGGTICADRCLCHL